VRSANADERSPEAPPLPPTTDLPSRVLRPHPAVFWVGLLLIVVSFGLYPAYALIALLPMSHPVKMAAAFSAWLISWGGFSVGTGMAGVEAIETVCRLWRRPGSS
jgi:hypothetical protein